MTHASSEDDFDYIIVGGGSAGCVLANRLSAQPKLKVLLIEAGGRDLNPWIHVPVGYLYTRGKASTDWCFESEPEPHLGGKRLAYPRGRVLGGCSSINGMVYTRGHASDYDHWRQLGNRGWGWDDVLPLFKRTERFAGAPSPDHGAAGEWHVEERREDFPLLEEIRSAAAGLGVPRNADFNSGETFGSGYYQINQHRGWRSSLATALLRPARRRPNLTVIMGALVHRLTFKDGRARTVEFFSGGQLHRLGARGEIVLAAGAIGSPAILQRSGVGDEGLLRELRIPVVAHLPGVGEDLQDHLQTRIVTRVSGTPTMNERLGGLVQRGRMALEFALRRTGPLTMAPSQLGGFVRSRDDLAAPDLQFFVQMGSIDAAGRFHDFPAVTIAICNLRPESRGSVRIVSGDPATPPAIRLNYLSAEADREAMVTALRFVRRLWDAPELAAFRPEEIVPGRDKASAEELLRAGAAISSPIFHPTSTCRMGADERAVVDDRLRLRGASGVRVVDASIMPRITAGNTNAPTVMIAEKGAEMILEDRDSG